MRAAAYARYSTEKQNSIAVQLAKISEYCQQHDLELVATYSDAAISGTRAHRPGFDQLLEAARRKEFEAIVIYDVTRGSRDVGDWFEFRKTMRLLGIQVFSTQDHLGDYTDPSNFLAELLTVGIGQHQVLTTRVKSMDKVAMLAKEGRFLGGVAPLGYDIQDGIYIVNQREAEAVQKIFTMYASGKSYLDIIKTMAADGVMGRRGRPLGKNSLHSILTNERYIGTYSWNKRQVKFMSKWAGGKPREDAVVIEGIIPRIIDDETWRKVRIRMEQNKHNKVNKSRVGREYLLSGLLRCGYCGASLSGVTTTNPKGYEYKFYTCTSKHRTHTCKAKNIAANDIEPLLVNLVKDALLNGDLIDRTADAILAVDDTGSAEIGDLKKEKASLEIKIANLLKALEQGAISDALMERLNNYETRCKALEERIALMDRKVDTVAKSAVVAELRKDADRILADPGVMKEILQKYIVKVVVFDDCIEIHTVCDLGLPGTKKVCTSKTDVHTDGCGGRI